KQTGAIVVRILNGEKAGDIDINVAAGTDLVINPAAAEKIGLTLPKSIVDRATKVIK
ncbi:MAG: ABC transporter permease, partial [Rhizobiales bacterium]|nr:ABC transporter permease [Hyphomicrobiales bacterium]